MKTNFENLDKVISKLNNSSLTIIAGRPNTGKSTLAFNIATNVVKKERIPVAIFSLEMSKEYICNNFIDSSLGDTKIIIEETPGNSVENIRKKCIRLKQEENIGLVVIDYLQLISTEEKADRKQEISTISQILKHLAEELNISIIVTSQLSKEPDIRFKAGQNPKPTLNDFGYSSDIVEYADVILLLYRENYYYPNSEKEDILEVNIAKSVYGKSKILEIKF